MQELSKLPQILARGDWPAAEALLRRAARHQNAPAAVFYNLAKVLEMRGHSGEIKDWLERTVAVDPTHADAWFELGRNRMATDLAAAEVAFAQSAALQPASDCWRNLARIRLRLCDWDGCAEALVHLPEDTETQVMAYRVACERGEDASDLRARLLAEARMRPDALKALTRVARGSLPLRLPQAR